MRSSLSALVLWLAVSPLHAQSAPAVPSEADETFHAEVVKLYDFQPGTLPQPEMEAKSGELDAFWEQVKAQEPTLGPALRRELARSDVPSFFLYDGSMLLLDLGRKPSGGKPKAGAADTAASAALVDKEDAKLVIAALARCTLKGIQHTDYLRKVHWLASEGNDTTAAALHVLDEPSFQAFIPQHALTLGQNYSLICMLMPTDEAFYLQPVLERLATEKDEKACASLLHLLFYAATEAGDAAIAGVAADESRSRVVRDAAAKFELQVAAIPMKFKGAERARIAAAVTQDVDASIAELKAARRRRMQSSISDEALRDLDQFTLLIRSRAP